MSFFQRLMSMPLMWTTVALNFSRRTNRVLGTSFFHCQTSNVGLVISTLSLPHSDELARLSSSPFSSSSVKLSSFFFHQSHGFCSGLPNPKELSVALGLAEDEDSPTFTKSMKFARDIELVSRILIEHHNPYHTMEASLQLNGIQLSPSLVHQVLQRLKNVSKIALGFFSWAKEQASYQHDVECYNLMIDILGKVHQFDVIWQLIMEMDQEQIGPTNTTFYILIRRHIAAGFTRQAIRSFDDMVGFIEREHNSDDFIFLLDTLCKYGHVKLATEIFNKRKFQFTPDAKMYTVLVYGWSKFNKQDMARKFFNEMIDHGIEPNVVTYNVLLNGICRRARLHPDPHFDQTIEEVEELLKEMRFRGIDPDATSYSIVLHVYSRAHKPNLSLLKLGEMKERGISPTIATYTSVIKCLCSSGRIGDAEGLLDEMTADGVCPTAETYNCFFKEYRGRNDADSALKLYRKVKGSLSLGLPSIHTYSILIGMFSKLNKMEIVNELWTSMTESGIGPDLDSYTCLIHNLCERKKWREACHHFVQMIEKGFLPQKVTFETLYRGLIQSDMLRTWRRLKKKLDEETINFNTEYERYHFKPYSR